MAQEIYISPKKILSYLKDFEEKLPLPQKAYFVSTFTVTPLTIEALNYEVDKMAEFIGLVNFRANCKWTKLPKGVGGQILLDNRRSGTLDIQINEDYKNEQEVTSATLAHELCHKYLQIHGIYYPNVTEINEIFTDLCTMYVGFGNIIIKGYSTKNWESGYLNYPIYQRTNNLIRMVIWGEENQAIKEYAEPFLDEALNLWISSPNKRNLSRNEYIRVYDEFTEYQKNIEIFKQMLYMMDEKPLELAKEIDEKMYNPNWFEGEEELKHKVDCFVGIYEGLIIKEKFKDTPIHSINTHLKRIIAQMVDTIGRNRFPSDIIYRLQFECPYCKQKASVSKIAYTETIVKCPNCKKRFAVDGNPFDLIPARNDLDNLKNDLMIPIKKSFENAIYKKDKDAIKKEKAAYIKGYDEGKAYIKRDLSALEKKIDNLPKWLKWLIGNRLK